MAHPPPRAHLLQLACPRRAQVAAAAQLPLPVRLKQERREAPTAAAVAAVDRRATAMRQVLVVLAALVS